MLPPVDAQGMEPYKLVSFANVGLDYYERQPTEDELSTIFVDAPAVQQPNHENFRQLLENVPISEWKQMLNQNKSNH